MQNRKLSTVIVAQSATIKQPKKRSPQRTLQPTQLSLWEPPQSQNEATPYLQIESVAFAERVNPKEHRYKLVILPYGVRATGGQFTADEAHEIAKATKGWDWSLNVDGRLRCLPKLEALLDSIIKRSAEVEGSDA